MSPLMTCALLAQGWPWNPALGDPGLDEDACAVAIFDIAGRFDTTMPDPGIATQARLQRSRVELGVASRHNILGRVAIDGRQSAPDTGYLGLEGESWYVRVQIAEARYVLPRAGLSVAAGLVDDPWVIRGNQAWSYRPLAPIVSERQGLTERSDFGGALTWTGPSSVVAVTVSSLNGEGLQRRERNAGKSTHLLLEARPLAFTDDLGEALVVTLYGRDGSKGTLSARDHRLGLRVHGTAGPLGYGGSVLKAYGVQGDADRVPLASELWAFADIDLFTAAARLEVTDQIPGTEQTTDVSLFAAAGVRPRTGPGRPAHLMLGVQHDRLGALSAPVPGGDGTANRTLVFAQLGLNLMVNGALNLNDADARDPS